MLYSGATFTNKTYPDDVLQREVALSARIVLVQSQPSSYVNFSICKTHLVIRLLELLCQELPVLEVGPKSKEEEEQRGG